jgi:transposase-like protein
MMGQTPHASRGLHGSIKRVKAARTRRRWPLSEKRRIVELTLRPGASLHAIAIEHGVSRTGLCNWKSLYRAGKLDASAAPHAGSTTRPTFLPVSIEPVVRKARPVPLGDAGIHGGAVLQLAFPSGTTMRIETSALNLALIGALIAELRR